MMHVRSHATPALDRRCVKTTRASLTALVGLVRCGLTTVTFAGTLATQLSCWLRVLGHVAYARLLRMIRFRAVTTVSLLMSRAIRASIGRTMGLSAKMLRQCTGIQTMDRRLCFRLVRCHVGSARLSSTVQTDQGSWTKGICLAVRGKILGEIVWSHGRRPGLHTLRLGREHLSMAVLCRAVCVCRLRLPQRHVEMTVFSWTSRAGIARTGLRSRWTVRMQHQCTRIRTTARQRCSFCVRYRAAPAHRLTCLLYTSPSPRD